MILYLHNNVTDEHWSFFPTDHLSHPCEVWETFPSNLLRSPPLMVFLNILYWEVTLAACENESVDEWNVRLALFSLSLSLSLAKNRLNERTDWPETKHSLPSFTNSRVLTQYLVQHISLPSIHPADYCSTKSNVINNIMNLGKVETSLLQTHQCATLLHWVTCAFIRAGQDKSVYQWISVIVTMNVTLFILLSLKADFCSRVKVVVLISSSSAENDKLLISSKRFQKIWWFTSVIG